MRRKKDSIHRNLNKKIHHRKLFLNFLVFFLILELLFLPLSAASFTTSDGLDGNTKTTCSDNTPPAMGNETSNSGDESTVTGDTTTDGSTNLDDTSTNTNTDSTVVDDTSTDSGENTYNVNDKTSDSSGNSYVKDNEPTDSNDNSIVINDKTSDSSGYTNVDDNDVFYAPNERIVKSDEIVSISENTLGDLSSGIETEVNIEYFDDIDSVKLTPAKNLEEVKITVIKLKDKPEEIIDPPKKNVSIYKYLDIKLISNETYVDEDEINKLEFKFKVEKSWINNNKIEKSTIKLIRYHDGVWQNLSTTLGSENESFIYYIAVSPGFSTFAVVGSKVVEKSESYSSDEMNIPWSIIFAFIISLTIMLVFILFKARYIYLKDDSK